MMICGRTCVLDAVADVLGDVWYQGVGLGDAWLGSLEGKRSGRLARLREYAIGRN